MASALVLAAVVWVGVAVSVVLDVAAGADDAAPAALALASESVAAVTFEAIALTAASVAAAAPVDVDATSDFRAPPQSTGRLYGAASSLRASRRAFFCCMTKRRCSTLLLVCRFSRSTVRHLSHSGGPATIGPAASIMLVSAAEVCVDLVTLAGPAAAAVSCFTAAGSAAFAASASSLKCSAREQRHGLPAAAVVEGVAGAVLVALHAPCCWQRFGADAAVVVAAVVVGFGDAAARTMTVGNGVKHFEQVRPFVALWLPLPAAELR